MDSALLKDSPSTRVEGWSTADASDPAFERRWRELLARAGHAHFGFDPAFLSWEAAHGRPALAVLAEQDGRRAALVLREERGGWVCGWPWRWHAVVEGSSPDPRGLTAPEAEWLFGVASSLAGDRRLRCYLPGVPHGSAYGAGSTIVNRLDLPEPELLKLLDDAKRRAIRKAQRAGYEVIQTRDQEHCRAFAALQNETGARRGEQVAPLAESPAPGEAWREWELPWMELLVAMKNGRVEAGSGFGFFPGAVLDYRTNASGDAGRREGANVLLGWEALRRGAERGFRWLNWGGATRFKRELGGTPVPIVCRLGGGARWALPNHLTASIQRARPQVARWTRALRGSRA